MTSERCGLAAIRSDGPLERQYMIWAKSLGGRDFGNFLATVTCTDYQCKGNLGTAGTLNKYFS